MGKNQNAAGHLAALATVVVWGTTFISTKVLLRAFAPQEILLFRFTLGYAVLWLLYPRPMRVEERRRELYFLGAGMSGISLYFLMENVALTMTLASHVGVIISAAPFFTAILDHLVLKEERPGRSFFVGFAAAILGIGLISFHPQEGMAFNLRGDLMAVAAAFLWAIYSILMKKIGGFGYPTLGTTRRIFFYGILSMVPILAVMGIHWGFERFRTPHYAANLLFLGVGASAVCYVIWNFSLRVLGAVRTSVYIYLIPVVTILTSTVVLRERITPISALGAALTVAGLFISERKS